MADISNIPLGEPVAVTDVFATEALPLEYVAPGVCRVTFAAKRRTITGEPEREITCRVVITDEGLTAMARAILRAYPASLFELLSSAEIGQLTGTEVRQ